MTTFDITKEELEWLNSTMSQCNDYTHNKKAIVFGYEYWTIGGVERALLTIMEGLRDKYLLFLFVPKIEKDLAFYEIPPYIKVVEFVKGDISLARQMAIAALNINAKLFIGNGNLNVDFLNVYKELKKFGIKSIMLNHYFWLFPYMHEAYLSKIVETRNQNMKYPDKIIGLTNISSYLCSVSSGRDVETIGNPNCFDKQMSIPIENRENIILTVGRFDDPIKRLDVILRMFSRIYKKYTDVKLVVVGTVKYKETFGKELYDELKELELPNKSVYLAGEQKNVEYWYAKAKLFLLASEMEGFGLVINEAGCFGLPVISNYYLGIEDMLTNGVNGYWFRTGIENDEKKIVDKMIQLLIDKKIWEEMSIKAYEMADRFSKEHIMSKWDAIIDNVLSEKIESIEKEKYRPSVEEYAESIYLYEKLTNGIVRRVNRSDACQEFLNSLYLKEKETNDNETIRSLVKKIVKRIKKRFGLEKHKN